jgi:hypothetical protein
MFRGKPGLLARLHAKKQNKTTDRIYASWVRNVSVSFSENFFEID